jgi:hypothetical protein
MSGVCKFILASTITLSYGQWWLLKTTDTGKYLSWRYEQFGTGYINVDGTDYPVHEVCGADGVPLSGIVVAPWAAVERDAVNKP